jgi:hypothetical protein
MKRIGFLVMRVLRGFESTVAPGRPARGALRIVVSPAKSKHTHFHADTERVEDGAASGDAFPSRALGDGVRLLVYIVSKWQPLLAYLRIIIR